MSSTRTYTIWQGMKARCDKKNTPFYKNYGGRGISYTKKWSTFNSFYKDMGEAPKGMTLERIDNEKGYSKENCKWATWIEQHSNTRRSVKLWYKGKNRTLSEISRMTGLSPKMLSKRLKRGWSEYDTINTKPLTNGAGIKI